MLVPGANVAGLWQTDEQHMRAIEAVSQRLRDERDEPIKALDRLMEETFPDRE